MNTVNYCNTTSLHTKKKELFHGSSVLSQGIFKVQTAKEAEESQII